jgi:hypothetical protein
MTGESGIAEYGDLAKGVNAMKTMIKYVAPILTAAAIGGPIGLAPVALAAPGSAPIAPSTATNVAPTPAPFGTGVDPLVPPGGGADPYVPNYPGMGRPF